MSAGKYQHLIAIQSVTTAQDQYAQPTRTYATVWQPWARVQAISGSESVDEKRGQRVAGTSHVFTIRYRAGVTPKHRILWGARKFEIVAVLDLDGDRTELEIHAREEA
jgi:SPP1 family predicted phage head-tail adaptor